MVKEVSFTKRKRTILVVEPLEPRILYAADTVVGALLVPAVDEESVAPFPLPPVELALDYTHESGRATEIVVVDSRVSDSAQLLSDITQQAQGRSLLVYELDAEQEGLDELSAWLSQHDEIEALHLIGHGSLTGIDVGATTLTLDTLFNHAQTLSQWSGVLSADADVLLYGCNVAATPGR